LRGIEVQKKKTLTRLLIEAEWAPCLNLPCSLVPKQKVQERARIDPHALTVPLLRAATPVIVIVLILRPSFRVITVVALVGVASREAEVIALGVVPSNVSRLIIAVRSATLRRHW
jgi:hypothetical protein